MTSIELTPEGLAASIRDLVTLPEVTLRVARMVDDPNSSANDIGRVISQDAALTARVLRVANSPAYGHHGEIATIGRAITVLGVRQVRDLTVGITAIRSFDGISNELVSMESFWRNSALCAIAAGQLAQLGHRRGDEGVFIAGLLHDIGQLVLFSRAPELEREALLMSVDSASERPLYLCERDVLGFDHCAVGAALARAWGLPCALRECIEFHHEPERAQEHPLAVAITHIANSIAVLAEIDSTNLEDAPELSEAAMRTAAVSPADLISLVARTQDAATEVMPLFIAA